MRNLILVLVAMIACEMSAAQSVGQDVEVSQQTERPRAAPQQRPSEHNMSRTMTGMDGSSDSLVDVLQNHTTSGTDAEPASTPFEMLMAARGKWTFMFHGEAFLNELQQSGVRGGTNYFRLTGSCRWRRGSSGAAR